LDCGKGFWAAMRNVVDSYVENPRGKRRRGKPVHTIDRLEISEFSQRGEPVRERELATAVARTHRG
jgi:hypothetical protein